VFCSILAIWCTSIAEGSEYTSVIFDLRLDDNAGIRAQKVSSRERNAISVKKARAEHFFNLKGLQGLANALQ
jgi:hypothetical protein